MAMNFNTVSDLVPKDETIDDLFLSQNTSNFDLNPADGSGSTGSQHSQLLLPSNTTLGFHQNDLISPSYQPSVGLGQLGFGQQVITEVRRTYVTPNRVQVHSFTDYSPLQNQLGFPPNEVLGFSEVTKTTRFLTPTSTMQRLFAPNYGVSNQGFAANDSAYIPRLIGKNSDRFQGQLNFRNQKLIPSNQLNPPIFNEIASFLNPHDHQNRPLNLRTPRIFDLDDCAEATGDGVILDPRRLSGYAFLNRGKRLVHEQSNINIRNPNPGESSKDHNQNDAYDGRTHSLPCKKYGPYKCPKCKGVFDMSQTFAAHMWSHYKYETNAERKKRLAARCKKRNLRLVKPRDEVTVPSTQSVSVEVKMYARKRKGRGEATTDGHEVEDEAQKQGREASSPNAELSDHGDMKKVKEENIAENSNVDAKKIKEEAT